MRPLVLIDPDVPPDDGRAWAQYGATQALTMLGVSFEVGTWEDVHGRGEVSLLIEPGGSMATRARGAQVAAPRPLGPTTGLLSVAGLVASDAGALPLLGPADTDPAAAPEAVCRFERGGQSLIGRLPAGLFATIGLYLSRFSWEGWPVADGSFVHQVDRLWDEQLAPRWGTVAVIGEYLLLLEDALIALYDDLGLPYVKKWPHPICEGVVRTHGLLLTHDVDAVYESPAFRRQSPREPVGGPVEEALEPAGQSANRWFNLRRWTELERSLGVRSAFYFMSPDPALEYWCTPSYNIADGPVAGAARALARLGWEVSIHQLGVDRLDQLAGERRWFERVMGMPPTGTRSHYLKHLPQTLSLKAAAGMAYDSTWYAETTATGFLCGTTRPFGPHGLATLKGPSPLWEFPFVVEDGIIFGVYGETPRSVAEAVAEGKRAFPAVLRHNGYLCLNAHQRTFDLMGSYGTVDNWTPAYEDLVRGLQAAAPTLWQPLPKDLADWWSARERVSLESTPDGIVATNCGPGPIGDLVICIPRTGRGSGWQPLTDGAGREWSARPTGLLRPGETRTYDW
jgi:hypothetical protein